MARQIDLSPINYQPSQASVINNSSLLDLGAQAAKVGAYVGEQRAISSLQTNIVDLESQYQQDKHADQQALATVKEQLSNAGNDVDTAELQTQAVKLAAKLRQGGSSLDYVTKLQVAAKQAKMKAPWASDKIEAIFQKHIGSEGASMIAMDYQASVKAAEQYQQQLLRDASDMGLHPSDPYLEEKVLQNKAAAYKLKTDTARLKQQGAEDALLSRGLALNAVTAVDQQIESGIAANVAQFGSLNNMPMEQKQAYIQQLQALSGNARLQVEHFLLQQGVVNFDKDHVNSLVSDLQNKAKLTIDMINGNVDSEIAKNGLGLAENRTMLDLYNKDPGLFKALMLYNKAPSGPFATQAEGAKIATRAAKFIEGEMPTDKKERTATINAVTAPLKSPDVDEDTKTKIGAAVVDALDKGIRNPDLMSAQDRDLLINSYRDPKTKAIFDKDPKAVPTLERAIQHKMINELPGAIQSKFDRGILKQVQMNVNPNGTVNFIPIRRSNRGDFEKAKETADILNRAIAPNINQTMQTWSAYSGDQGKISFNPFDRFRTLMVVDGDMNVEVQPSPKPQAPSPTKPTSGIRKIVIGPDGQPKFEN